MMRKQITYIHDGSVVDIGLKCKLCHMTTTYSFRDSIFLCENILKYFFMNNCTFSFCLSQNFLNLNNFKGKSDNICVTKLVILY
jgi:hypothetical protein